MYRGQSWQTPLSSFDPRGGSVVKELHQGDDVVWEVDLAHIA